MSTVRDITGNADEFRRAYPSWPHPEPDQPTAERTSPYPPGTPYFEVYPATPGTEGYSTKDYPTAVSQGTAEHNARRYSRDGRSYVVEHVDAEGKRSKVAEFRNGRKVQQS